jgi:phosphoribosyl-ATP pyrophosphohydrolase
MKNIEYLITLSEIIKRRRSEKSEKSYTATLMENNELLTKKIGEEAIELIISTLANDKENIKKEAADLIYHLMVLLEKSDLNLDDICAELSNRNGVSGHDEKKSRK